jgi:cytochrome bd-type quinol oxidase subunit 1
MQSNFFVFFGFLLLLLVGFIILQVFLSKRGSKWLGLILPIITFIFALLPTLGIWFFSAYERTTESVDGVIVKQTVHTIGNVASLGFTSLLVFILFNIPTIILLAIYFAFQERYKKERELIKMNIQDLDDL